MRIDIITVLPEMLEGFFNCSIMSRAQKKGIAEIHIHNLRDYAFDRYRKVDDYPFGGFAGMVMKIEPIDRCISALKAEREYDEVIFTSPDDELARKRRNSMGKTEMWYVIDNAGGKAHLRSGLKKKITPDEYAAMIADNTICDALADYTVQPGDVFFLPAGRIHSIGAGCFIAEIQQTSNVTYRIYDFNRKDKNGNTRELHTELSKDAIDYTVEEDYRTSYTPEQNKPIELVTCPYFTTSVYDLTENMTMDYSELDSFVIYICMEGSCTVTDNEGHSLEIQAGESILFPATTKEVNVTVNEHVKFLETYV